MSTHNLCFEAVLMSTHNLCFEQKYERYQSFLFQNFQFLEVKFSIYLNRRVFVMGTLYKHLSPYSNKSAMYSQPSLNSYWNAMKKIIIMTS